MNTIVLFTKSKTWDPRSWVMSMEGGQVKGDHFVVEMASSWISLNLCENVFEDYENVEEDKVKTMVTDPTAHLVEWKGDEIIRKFIDNFPTDQDAVVDNDHGLICKLVELKGMEVGCWSSEKLIKN